MSQKYLLAVVILIALVGWLLNASANEGRFSGVFVISEISVSNDEAYQRYRKAVKPVIENCGGTYVVRAGGKFVSENPSSGFLNTSGGWNPDRLVVLHFENKEQIAPCFQSAEYKAAYALREGGTTGKSLVVNAYQPD